MDLRGGSAIGGKQYEERKHVRGGGDKFAPKGKSEGVHDPDEERIDGGENGIEDKPNRQQLEQLLIRARKIVKRLEEMLGVGGKGETNEESEE